MRGMVNNPYYDDPPVTLYHGQAAEVLAGLPDGSVDCCVTSPPYFGLRDYGVDGQIGAESTPSDFIANLVDVFREVRRILADDGTCWVNLGDSYSASGGHTKSGGSSALAGRSVQSAQNAPSKLADRPAKNLLGMPWRLAFAMQDDGWILRNAIVWHKPNAMPESVTDRLSTRYEMLFLFAKSQRYWFDLDPIRESYEPQLGLASSFARATKDADVPGQAYRQHRVGREDADPARSKNPGDVWIIPTTPFPGAHFAVYPPEIPRRAIVSGCKPGGTVLDPFSGSGTTGMVALQNGRKYVGIDLNSDYLDLSLRTRLSNGVLDFGSAS